MEVTLVILLWSILGSYSAKKSAQYIGSIEKYPDVKDSIYLFMFLGYGPFVWVTMLVAYAYTIVERKNGKSS